MKGGKKIMKRGLKLTLVTIVLALMCSGAYAYAPIIGGIPDVYIGDREDNYESGGSTVDINFFRFSNAFNFDLYVSFHPEDEEGSTTNTRWSFFCADGNLVTINGIETLSDPSESLMPDLVSKELTAWGNNDTPPRATSWATFYDLADSPIGTGPPWGDPLTAPETVDSPLDTQITIYASNGSKTDSRSIAVKANVDAAEIDMPDLLSGGISKIFVFGWSAPASAFDKGLLADGLRIDDPSGTTFYVGTRNTDGNSIYGQTSTDPTRNTWSPWYSPDDQVAYQANNVYIAEYTIRTSQTDASKVPNVRMYTDYVGTGILAVSGGNRVGTAQFQPAPFVPDADGEVYNIYSTCPVDMSSAGVTNLRIDFEVIDFAGNEEGTVYLDEVNVYRFETPSKGDGTLVATYNPADLQANWGSIVLGSPFGDATVGSNSTGLFIQTPLTVSAPVAGNIDAGMWSRPANGTSQFFEADRLYRCIYTLSSPNQNTVGKIRIYNANKNGTWSALIELVPDQIQVQMPPSGGQEYDVWFETEPTLYSGGFADLNEMNYNFDVSDGSNTQVGTVYLEKVELYYYDIP
jgi:hypothetical protein